jgi:predicted AlkP superfamily pyrophosphatase or phosphodiesterase
MNTFKRIVVVVVGAVMLVGSSASAKKLARPKLVVGIAVDQMRWDYLYRYYNDYGDNGFKRLIDEGYSCDNTMINYIPSTTANGHTSIWTGSVPAISGIDGNNFYVNGKFRYCTSDETVKGVGTTSHYGQMSPRNEVVSTIGDELKIATEFQSKVIGIALKDRAAILPAGHAADGAFWLDSKTAKFVSSTYYMDKLPRWVEKYNKSFNASYDSISMTPLGIDLTERMAEAAIEAEQLGAHENTDLLCVSFSSTDKLAHAIGGHNPRIKAMYLDLDNRLADLLTYLDKKIGKGQYLVFLTADHGGANNVEFLNKHRIPGGNFSDSDIKKGLESALQQHFGKTDKFVDRIFDCKVQFQHENIASMGLTMEEVKKFAIDYLKKSTDFAYIVDMDNLGAATVPSLIREKIINGYNRLRGGDIQMIPQTQYYSDYVGKDGTTHFAWNPYDAHIPFLLMGWGVPHGKTVRETHITDIAPTICSLINIQMPSGCVGNAVELK